jgi:hypothetical protein
MAGVQGQMTVTTTPAPVRVGTTNANRKMVTISTSGKDDIYWGWNSEVTSSTGTPLDPWSFNTFAVNKDIDIWLVVADGSDTVRITEVI